MSALPTSGLPYSKSRDRGDDLETLLWLRTTSLLLRGAPLEWLSAFPHEREFVCLRTYSQPTFKPRSRTYSRPGELLRRQLAAAPTRSLRSNRLLLSDDKARYCAYRVTLMRPLNPPHAQNAQNGRFVSISISEL